MNTTWPTQIAEKVDVLLGPVPDVTTPGGMSGASVQRLTGDGSSLILKRSENPREWHVYTALGETLFDADVAKPEMYAEAAEGDTWWLLLEDVEHPLPEERRLADPDVIGTLRNLHGIPASRITLPFNPYVPAWPEAMTRQALTLFGPPVADSLARSLERIRLACQPLFEPRCPVSADPNPANWGLREDGSPVLFDWERFALATPALDLGISVPGLGTMDAFSAVSSAYDGGDGLKVNIARAKVWSVVEFLSGYAAGEIDPAFDIAALIDRVPAWIEDLSAASV